MKKKILVKRSNIIRALQRTSYNDWDVASFKEAFDEIGYPDGLSPNAYGLDIPIGHWLISPGDDLPLEVVFDLEKRFPEEDYREIVDDNLKHFVKSRKSNSTNAPVTYVNVPIGHWLIAPGDDMPLAYVISKKNSQKNIIGIT